MIKYKLRYFLIIIKKMFIINNVLQNNLLTQTQFLMRDTLDLN